MARFSKKIPVRSISLPSRSHPSTLRVNEELNNLRVLESSNASTSESIFKGLSGLEDLFVSVDELLNLASTKQALSQHRHQKCIDDLLDVSLRILDACQFMRDILFKIEEEVNSLQSALRRRKGDPSMKSSIKDFISFRKKMNKHIKKMMTQLKQNDNKRQALGLDNDQLSALIRAMSEVSSMNVSIFQSLLAFLSVPMLKPKSQKWSLVSKLMKKGKVSSEDKISIENEIQSVDDAVYTLLRSFDSEKMQSTQKRLEALNMSLEGFETILVDVSRRLIKTRASLLNILSL